MYGPLYPIVMYTRKMSNPTCSHKKEGIVDLPPRDESFCDDCIPLGDTWIALRKCLTCGHVGCCDSSKNKHATKHYKTTGHPIIKSVTKGEEFMWCYVDEMYI